MSGDYAQFDKLSLAAVKINTNRSIYPRFQSIEGAGSFTLVHLSVRPKIDFCSQTLVASTKHNET